MGRWKVTELQKKLNKLIAVKDSLYANKTLKFKDWQFNMHSINEEITKLYKDAK